MKPDKAGITRVNRNKKKSLRDEIIGGIDTTEATGQRDKIMMRMEALEGDKIVKGNTTTEGLISGGRRRGTSGEDIEEEIGKTGETDKTEEIEEVTEEGGFGNRDNNRDRGRGRDGY